MLEPPERLLDDLSDAFARQPELFADRLERHVHSILAKLRLPETGDDHRRVLAVITFLEMR
jgi:hypothetical protein